MGGASININVGRPGLAPVRRAKAVVLTLVLVVGVSFAIVRGFYLELVEVRGVAMLPGFSEGEARLVHQGAPVGLGDVVLLERDGVAVLSRVLGLEGDRLASHEGSLVRNDQPLESEERGVFVVERDGGFPRRYVRRVERSAGVSYEVLGGLADVARPWMLELEQSSVADAQLFVLCDNRPICGPATKGLVSRQQVVGVVGRRLWGAD